MRYVMRRVGTAIVFAGATFAAATSGVPFPLVLLGLYLSLFIGTRLGVVR